MPRLKLRFANADGQQLDAALEEPAGAVRGYALFAHCFTCSKDSIAASRISRALMRLGIGVLRFDFTGLGNSEGDFANTNFSSNLSDLVAAAKHLASLDKAPQLLIGHSLGGTAVLAAASQIPGVRAVATIAAPAEPSHLLDVFGEDAARITTAGEASVAIDGRHFTIKRQFIDDLAGQHVLDRLRGMHQALLIMHSPVDAIVNIDEARRIFEAARHPKSFVSLDSADHLLSRRGDAEYAAEILAAWASRFLISPQEAVNEGEVVVESSGRKFTQTIRAGKHVLAADEPVQSGGDDAGPSPYDLLLAALGACTSMTLRMYANHKGWPLESIAVHLKHDRVHSDDCKDCESKEALVERIERRIHLEGALDDAQRARLLEIAERCPVHKTLRSRPEIVSRLED